MTSTTATPIATVTTTDATGAPVDIAPLAGYLTYAEAAERTGRKPWAVHELVEAGQLATVTFNGRPHVSATDVAALA